MRSGPAPGTHRYGAGDHALACGLIAAIGAVLPIIGGVIAIPAGALAIILGCIGITRYEAGRAHRIAPAVAGAFLGTLALFLSVILLIATHL